jgi:hypothetical protein
MVFTILPQECCLAKSRPGRALLYRKVLKIIAAQMDALASPHDAGFYQTVILVARLGKLFRR